MTSNWASTILYQILIKWFIKKNILFHFDIVSSVIDVNIFCRIHIFIIYYFLDFLIQLTMYTTPLNKIDKPFNNACFMLV
jgi:hypothetical protein